MPEKYHIHTVPTPGRFRRVGKYGNVDWREDCSRCINCVKPRCVYDVYKHEVAHNRDPLSAVQPHDECKACLSCVQGCTKGLLSIGLSPEYLDMGDAYFRPETIATTWNQADTGRIPVSGAGYRGRFSGPGFDSIWTDMSEIVRPTRDGIHGREYISTMVEIGTKPMRLEFSPDGKMIGAAASVIEIQLPAILDLTPWPMVGTMLSLARAAAAKKLHTLAVIPAEHVVEIPIEHRGSIVPLVGDQKSLDVCAAAIPQVLMVEVSGEQDVEGLAKKITAINPKAIVALRMELGAGAVEKVSAAARGPWKVIHLCADLHGCETLADGSRGRHIKDVVREIHGRLVKDGRRDEITLIVGGGIALAEHMAKAIICGADLVAVNAPLLVALGCRVCKSSQAETHDPAHCPAALGAVELPYAVQRMVNLMGAWHSQLIEVLGAMGIREIRRLRGEVGRAMFLEDIEKEAFGDLVRK